MVYLEPLVDNTKNKLEDEFHRFLPESEEVRISTGYFYLSGFDILKEDIRSLYEPGERKYAPLRILMGRQTDRQTSDEISKGQNLREQFRAELNDDIESLNYAQLDRLERLREFIEQGYVDIRVRTPEQGYYHAKGVSYRIKPESDDVRAGDTDRREGGVIVGSSNFTASGQRNNIELNLAVQNADQVTKYEEWYDNQWANAEEFSEDIVEVIETSDRYQSWKEQQEVEPDDEETGELGQYLEPFELYKLLAYDALSGNVTARDSPLYYFQSLGYESAKEKLSQYNGCIISDSVGLGKSFIGGELLYDYRQVGDRCLLIVPANLTEQWTELLQDQTDEDGNSYFGLTVDGTHLDVMSISKFQNLTYDEVKSYKEAYDVVLIDEAHRFRNHGKWEPDPDHDDDYKGTRRHANLRQLRGKTMILLTATPINNSATDLKNLISLFTSGEGLRNKASLDFGAFDEYIDLAERRKRAATDEEPLSDDEEGELTEKLRRRSEEISKILNEVMVLRTRKHVKDEILDEENFEMSFSPPSLSTEEYSLPPAYQPVYRMLPDVMDALHLPHITISNPQSGSTLKALYKLNLLKRLESSTFAFVQSLETLHESERSLLRLLEALPADEPVDSLRGIQEGEESTLDDFVEGADAVSDLEDTLAEFGFDTDSVRGDGDDTAELENATVAEVRTFIREDLTILSYFLSRFIGDVAKNSDAVRDLAVETRGWLDDHGAGVLPDVPEEAVNPILYPDSELAEIDEVTRDFYDAVFGLRAFRDPKIERLRTVLEDYDRKVLVFTQYRATAEYVYRTLVEDADSPLTDSNSAVVKGGDENKQDVIKRFAPEASGYQRTLSETDESELQYVVATDTLSEGVNLQDVDVVVNYDLPWNPMRIVQRVGRVDRIGSTAEKYVHNFHPDGDIEAAIQLLERLQAKINDIALIVGKENNILDPNEDQILERAGVETEKTIGELEVEEIEQSLRESRSVGDINELDDTSKNPLLRHAGSDENDAYERYLLKNEIDETFDLDIENFEFAEGYFDDDAADRPLLYTNVTNNDGDSQPGVFGLAHLWFDEEDDQSPLGRVQRAFYHKPFGGDVRETHVRTLRFTPETEGTPISTDTETSRVLEDRGSIEDLVAQRLESIRENQVEGAFLQGGSHSKEQETLISFCRQYIEPRYQDQSTDGPYDSVSDRAQSLRKRLSDVGLDNTDEDRVLRDRFRHNDEYETLPKWPIAEFLDALEEFLDEYVAESTEYQETLVSESDVRAKLMCWGVIGS